MNSKCILLVFIFILNVGHALSAAEVTNAVIGEIEIEPAGQLARVSVYLANTSETNQTLITGRVGTHSRGVFHAVDFDKVANEQPHGNGELVTPELTFGAIKFSPPTTVAWGATMRNMAPTLLQLREGERALYCVFSVPAIYVRSEFAGGKMRFPGIRDNTAVDVSISKCIRKTEAEKTATERAKPPKLSQ